MKTELANLVSHTNNQLSLSEPNSNNQYLNESLVNGIAKNNKEAIENAYAQFFPSVLNFVLKNNGDESDARELFQKALIAFWMEIKEEKNFQENEIRLGEYIFQIAKYKWSQNALSRPAKSIDRLPNYNPDKEREIEEKIKYLTALYRTLGNNGKEVLKRFYFERKSMSRIAEELNISASSLNRIRRQCMRKLSTLYVERKELQQINLP